MKPRKPVTSSNLIEIQNDQVGPLFVPATNVPSTTIVSPEIKEEMLIQYPNDSKLKGAAIANDGEMAEKIVNETLREHYGAKSDAVLIINNLKMFKFDATKKEIANGDGQQEADFIVVNNANLTIMNIEVKQKLGKYDNKPEKEWPSTKVKKQLDSIKKILGDTFQADTKGPWKIISVVFCLEMDPEFRNCSNCNKFIAEGKEELLQLLKYIDVRSDSKFKHPEEFVNFCKLLLFCCPVVPLPVGGQLTKVIQEAIKKSGTCENILIWCFPTPHQRSFLKFSKVIFASPFGSGKTLFMTNKAIELAEGGQEVMFLLFVDAKNVNTSNFKSLLMLDLEEKFKKHPNIHVKMVPFMNGKSNNFDGVCSDKIKHVMIDELFGDFNELAIETKQEFKEFIAGKIYSNHQVNTFSYY